MPNRILKESVCTSPNIEGLSWFEEVCFYRLLVQCDDYGRLDARPLFLRSRLFPLRDDIDSAAISAVVERLEQAGLITTYTAAGQPFLEVCKWSDHQRVRNKRVKYPPPVWAVNEEEVSTDC